MIQTNISPTQVATLSQVLQKLRWRTIKLTYQVMEEGRLPRLKASGLRGMLGHVLMEKAPDLYESIFEVKNVLDHPMGRRYRDICSPYIISVPDLRRNFRKGNELDVYLTLIGQAENHFPRLLGLIQDWQGRGLGKEHIPLKLTAMNMMQPYAGIPVKEPFRLELQFRTPLVLKTEDHSMAAITLPLLVHRMAERMAILSHFHCGAELITDFEDYKELAAKAIWAEMDLRKVFWSRYSTRQEKSSQVGGWVGKLAFDEVDTRLLPLFHLAKHLHLGKCTTWGMGRLNYQLTPLPVTADYLLEQL